MSVDDDIRKALTALEATVPDGYFDALPGRIELRLEEGMDADMSTDTDDRGAGKPPADAPVKKEENTGLHDIRAMAQSAKRRVSRRVTTESDVQEQILLSASTSMNQVVLPDPNKEVPVELEPVAAAATPGAEAASRGGIPVWVYGAVAVVAAAAVVFFVIRGKKSDEATDRVASGDVAASDVDRGAGAQAAATAPSGAATPGEVSAEPLAGDRAGGDGEGTAEENGATDDQGGDVAVTATGGDSDTAAAGAGGGPAAPAKDTADRKVAHERAGGGKPAHEDKPTPPADPSPAKPAKSPAKSPPKPPGGGGRTLDDLLDEAAGPVVANKDQGGAKPDDAPKAPARTDISREDISAGMSKVLGRVQACYDKFQQTGTVMIDLTIENSGKVSSADAIAKFAGTETGSCVAAAVMKANFPSWDGKPKKIKYPFLLSP